MIRIEQALELLDSMSAKKIAKILQAFNITGKIDDDYDCPLTRFLDIIDDDYAHRILTQHIELLDRQERSVVGKFIMPDSAIKFVYNFDNYKYPKLIKEDD